MNPPSLPDGVPGIGYARLLIQREREIASIRKDFYVEESVEIIETVIEVKMVRRSFRKDPRLFGNGNSKAHRPSRIRKELRGED